MSGTWYGQSASNTVYFLATVLERVDNDFLWYGLWGGSCYYVTEIIGHRLAIMGLTYQYTTSRISRADYDKYHPIFYDEVFRLNPPATAASSATTSLHPDDSSIRATDELRFLLFRHWNLYDAMYHSSYVAGKLGIWKERGRKKLSGLLAKMG
jgi:cell division control protein 45